MSLVYHGAHRSVFLFLIALATPGFSQESVFVNNPGLPALGKSSVQWADFDNDGWPDVVMNGTDAFGTKQCAIYRNQRDNSFVNLGAGLPPTDDGGLAVGDVNLDGLIDILISGWNTQNQRISRLYLNQGGGNFVPDTTTLAGVVLGKSAIAMWTTTVARTCCLPASTKLPRRKPTCIDSSATAVSGFLPLSLRPFTAATG